MIVFLTEIGTRGRESVGDDEFSVGQVESEVLEEQPSGDNQEAAIKFPQRGQGQGIRFGFLFFFVFGLFLVVF